MKRSLLRRMSSTPLPEFEVDAIKVEEPETTEGLTGSKFVYTLRSCPMGKFSFRKPKFDLIVLFLAVSDCFRLFQAIKQTAR